MINLMFSFAAGLASALAIKLLGFSLWAAVLPALLVFFGLYVALAYRTGKQLQATIGLVQAELSSMPPNPKEQKNRADKAIKLLEDALSLGRWQFLVAGEIQGQIGMIKYLFKDQEGAMAAFLKTHSRNFMARAYQAAIYFQRKDFTAMEKSFEEAVTAGKKESIVWAAYAWCLEQSKQSNKALGVLARAVTNNPSDEKLKAALAALQNDKRLKMKAWEPMWWQFGLEAPPTMQPQFTGGRGRPRFARR
jgi:tetratricopeptide (TPR) repeat protein